MSVHKAVLPFKQWVVGSSPTRLIMKPPVSPFYLGPEAERGKKRNQPASADDYIKPQGLLPVARNLYHEYAWRRIMVRVSTGRSGQQKERPTLLGGALIFSWQS
ncbi:MAG: hypothetical protein C4589_11745 [Peptococcaceae bacterium]|nr:MAG: hypothetical protein C4589_11745 [Peptococcaceae bacterium]